MLSIDSQRIDLWFVFLDDIPDEALLREYRKLLSETERQKELRFHFERDRRRYVVTRALQRVVLSKYVGIAPEQWRFVANAYGRPELANDSVEARRITFNISYTSGLVMLGVARERALGVDVENVRIRSAPVDVADRFFAADEVAALQELPSEQQQQRFFEYWTLKESYIKARKMGLSIPLDQFAFHFPGAGAARMTIDAEQADDPCRWQFWLLQLRTEFMLAVCAERVRAGPSWVAMKRIVPLVAEDEHEYSVLRVSD